MELETKNEIIANYNTFFYATMCHVCKRFGNGVCLKKCGGCRMIAYCNRQHQKQHWSQHKSLCKAIQDILRDFKMENHGTSEEWDDQKLNLILLISFKLGRPLEMYEKEMFLFPRECTVCHEQDGQLLEDCQSCVSVSFCKDHKDSIKHKDTCVSLELCLHSNLLFINGEDNTLDMHYLQYVFYTDTFRNMNDFINIYGNIQIESEMSYNILAARHSQYLTRPLTLFHAMQILDYVPQRKDLVIHVIAANYVEETTLMTWEILLHLIKPIISLVVIMIGPELKYKSNLLHICDNCILQKKKLSLEFYDVLYEDYLCNSLFIKPDLVVGFNAGIHEHISNGDTWTPSIQMLAKQNYPLILTCYMQKELEEEIDRINTILDRKVNYLYSGKNPFASLRPFRVLGPEQVFYQNHYLIVYKSLCS
ncbi:Zinc finger MYND domain-containing protein 17 [Trachymyrmex septentrionalis]|uniref:Zinc finger MYND domain-containing protein 17 n=1 Tax=Trachymyrmex septentrionalis TaxID=34720 RepID=A0A195FFM2_9HYME|nr:PREDICTED: putative protein MSS51 homolog, mitochondrial [Trachymyrmex septentrionalis]KYN38824.1 Zinc finger MYND domain-containing protein 17 [Trachymyrmex septentrionalis]